MNTPLKSFSEFVQAQPSRSLALAHITGQNKNGRQLDTLAEVASLNRCPYRVYVGDTKYVGSLREAMSKHARSIVEDRADTLIDACRIVREQGVTDLIVVSTEPTRDRVLIEASSINFRSLKVIGSEREARVHVQLDSVGELREKYVKGELFEVGSDVVIKATQEIAKVVQLGANYLLVEMAMGVRKRVWLDAVEQLDEKVTNNDSLPFTEMQYAPIPRKSLGIMPRSFDSIRQARASYQHSSQRKG
jgi:hypothetical protein